jgi:CheY-like chemotaxis protein
MSRPLTVLVVDDDADICDTLQLTLELNGLRVITACDGAKALALLRAGERPDVIILDLMMPVMTGFEFRAEQLRDPALARIPVVVLTGDGRAVEKGASLGAEAVQKPIALDALLGIVNRHCDSTTRGE